jgi:CRP-like cAMP-binding protein
LDNILFRDRVITLSKEIYRQDKTEERMPDIPRLFTGVSKREYNKISEALDLEPKKLIHGDELVAEGESTDRFWIVVSGSLKGVRLYLNGDSDLVQMYQSGDTVCLDVVCTRTRRSLLQIASFGISEVIEVDYDDLMALQVSPRTRKAIAGNIVRLLADDNLRKQYKVDVLYKRSLRNRICTFLQHMEEKTGATIFDIGMDREHLSQYLGVNRSALSHELSIMRSEGMIDFHKSVFELTPAFRKYRPDKKK